MLSVSNILFHQLQRWVWFNLLRPSDTYMRQQTNMFFYTMACRLVDERQYLKQWWNTINSNLGNKVKGNLKQNWYVFIHEYAFENIVCELAGILSRSQCVKVIYTLSLLPRQERISLNYIWYASVVFVGYADTCILYSLQLMVWHCFGMALYIYTAKV